jgi:hypothetical protein
MSERWKRMEQFEIVIEYQTRIDPRGMRAHDVPQDDLEALTVAGLVDVRDGGVRATGFGRLIFNEWRKVPGDLPDHPALNAGAEDARKFRPPRETAKEAHDE